MGKRLSRSNTHLVLACIALTGLAACVPSNGSAGKLVVVSATGNLATGTPSAASGKATLTALEGGKTRVVVNFTGLPTNSKHAGHIHAGTCATPGPVALPLSSVTTDAAGTGSSSTDLETAKIPASAYIAFHQRDVTSPEGIGAVIACGDIK